MTIKILDGLKVADFTWVAAGPLVTLTLAAHGATVIKIESMTRPDLLRTGPPFKDNTKGINRSAYFTEFNPDKLSIGLDLSHKSGKGIAIARRLIQWADVVTENFAPGMMKKWGLDYDSIVTIKPDIIMMSLSFCGQEGPYSDAKGYGNQLASLSGFAELTGWKDRKPVTPWGAYTDFIAPRIACAALLSALLYRKKTGKGMYLDLAQYEMGVEFLSPLILDYNLNKHLTSRDGNRSPCGAPHGVYPCLGEDRYCAIAIFTEDEWNAFCSAIGRTELVQDQRFATFPARKANEEALDNIVTTWTLQHTAEEVMSLLQMAGISAGRVSTARDLHEDPQFSHRHHYQVLDHPEIGPHSYSSLAFKLSKAKNEYGRSAPQLGQSNEYVMKEILKMTDTEFIELLVENILQQG